MVCHKNRLLDGELCKFFVLFTVNSKCKNLLHFVIRETFLCQVVLFLSLHHCKFHKNMLYNFTLVKWYVSRVKLFLEIRPEDESKQKMPEYNSKIQF